MFFINGGYTRADVSNSVVWAAVELVLRFHAFGLISIQGLGVALFLASEGGYLLFYSQYSWRHSRYEYRTRPLAGFTTLRLRS